MKHHRTLAVACLLAFGLAAADQAAAKKTPSPDPSSGYPNGRPWEAVDADFQIVFARIDAVKKDTVVILQRLDVIEDDLAALSNTLTVQVSVVPNVNRAGATNVPVVLNVLVSQNGAGVTGLQPGAFAFTSAFGSGGATYCGNSSCMVAGPGGVYQLRLDSPTLWSAGQYAGSLTASMQSGGRLAQGTTLVTFNVPATVAPN